MIRITLFVALVSLGVTLAVAQLPQRDAQAVSAQCNDGSLSHSATRSGTCARHGGVRKWVR